MKKRFLLILALAALLLVLGMTTALAATVDDGHVHWSWCDNPNVCASCGEAYDGSNMQHEYDSKYEWDDQKHWKACKRCGEQDLRSIYHHFAYCDKRDVCCICEAPYSGTDFLHNFDYDNWIHDENQHWHVCLVCGDKIDIYLHFAVCNESNVCKVCGAPYAGTDIEHDWNYSEYKWDENGHWHPCNRCDDQYNYSAHTYYSWAPDECAYCGYNKSVTPTEAPTEKPTEVPTATPTAVPTEKPTEAPTAVPTEKPTEAPTAVPTEKPTEVPTEVPTAAPTAAPTEAPTAVPTEKPTEAPTAVPTEKPTEVPTEVPTEAPTAVPTEKPTEAPTAVPTEKPTEAPTAVPTEKPTEVPTEVPTEAPTAVPTEKPTEAPTAAPTEAPTKAPHEHVFRTFVYRFDGMHWSQCEVCGYGVTRRCVPESKTVNGVPCEVCSICGHTTVPALTGIALPEESMADVSAVTTEGEAALVMVYDLTPSRPEGSVFALCLQVVPQDGAAMPGSVQITLPCAVDMANLRLIFIADGEAPVDVPYSVGGGMITFTVNAAGIFALVPVQE